MSQQQGNDMAASNRKPRIVSKSAPSDQVDTPEPKFCHEIGCLRKVLQPNIYCDEHVDKSSTPAPVGQVDTLRERLMELWFIHHGDSDPKAAAIAIEQVVAVCQGVAKEARLDELKQLKKKSTWHVAYKQNQYDPELDLADERLAVPEKKIDDRIAELTGSSDPSEVA